MKVINRSEHAVRWNGISFKSQEPGDTWLLPTSFLYGTRLPMPVSARDAAEVYLERAKLEESPPGLDWRKDVTVKVWLSTGEEFESEPRPLDPEELKARGLGPLGKPRR